MRWINPKQFMVVLVSMVLGAFMYWRGHGYPPLGIDDANIYMTYFKHWADGYGFVYNIGGERVEGFTSLLWTLLGGIFYKIGDSFPFYLFGVTVVLISAAVSMLVKLGDDLWAGNKGLRSLWLWFLLGLLIMIPGYIDWCLVSLMETGIWSALLVTAAVLNARILLDDSHRNNNILFGLVLVLLVLTRPESILWGPVFIGLRGAAYRVKGMSWRDMFIRALIFLGLMALTLFALMYWRMHYFGYPFPNTYYAKVSSDRWNNLKDGLEYQLDFFYRYGFYILFLIGIALWKIKQQVWRKPIKKINELDTNGKVQMLMWLTVGVGLGIPLLTGGDHFNFHRMNQPFVPLLLFGISNIPFYDKYVFDQPLVAPLPRWISIAIISGMFWVSPRCTFFRSWRGGSDLTVEFLIADVSRQSGYSIESTFEDFVKQGKELPSVGVIIAGGIGYVYDGEVIDLMGLNNVEMAHATTEKIGKKNHAAFHIPTFFKLAPDVFDPQFFPKTCFTDYPYAEDIPNQELRVTAFKHIFERPDFKAMYIPVITHLKDGRDLFLYYRKDYLEQIDRNQFNLTILPNA